MKIAGSSEELSSVQHVDAIWQLRREGATITPSVGSGGPAGGTLAGVLEEGKVSSSVKWVVCGVCAVVGLIALIYAVIYLAVPIHELPGFVPGKNAAINGHYHKRAALTGVIGVVLIAVAVIIGISARRSATDQVGSAPGTQAGSEDKEIARP
jgi:hypothetical protein